MNKFIKKINKYYEYILIKIKLHREQIKFNFDGTILKYMLKKSDNPVLVVVFSSCTRKGIKARYNYVKTMQTVNCNQLFILDDFAEDQRGGYYIGSNMNFNEERATNELIKKVISECKTKKNIFCGSSKGGWAALNFGLQYPDSYIVAGGPQFFLGTYLIQSENDLTLKHIVGDVNAEKIKILDSYLQERIQTDEYSESQCIYLHYSDNEHTYDEHIKYLLEVLKTKGILLYTDVQKYENHSDISLYFPEFLVKTIYSILE